MPRRSKGPRLYIRERKGRPPVFVILDGTTEVGTGCGLDDRRGAEKALEAYITRKHRPAFGVGDPAEVPVADVLGFYASNLRDIEHPELVGFHLTHLLEHFGDMTCAGIGGETCREYVDKRVSGKIGRRAVAPTTARRELETLSAALRFAWKEKKLATLVPVTLPAKAQPRERWLTRPEAARLLAGALGFAAVEYDVATRAPIRWGRVQQPAYHVARFILIGLYTGTRHEAILKLRWGVNSDGGWFDLDRERLYRRGIDERETNKRRTPARIPSRLLPHLRRWRRITTVGPVEYAGRLILKERRGFNRARELGRLGDEVTPHILRHTCTTWLLQAGVPTWEVAGYLGASEKMIEKHYGHHSPDFQAAAAGAFLGA